MRAHCDRAGECACVNREECGEDCVDVCGRVGGGANTAQRYNKPQMKNGRRSVRFLSNLVAWDGIEPPTQGFSKRAADSKPAPHKALRVARKRKAA